MDFSPQIPCGACRRFLRWLGHLVDPLSLINKARNPVTKRSKLPAI
jgi:cytidine deaminase